MPDGADEHVHGFPIRSGRKMRPEEGLAIAVFEDAVRTFQRYNLTDDRAARILVAEVDEWFACNDTDHPFTFVSICDVLALDVAYVRSGLRHWRDSQQAMIRTKPRVLHLTGRRRPKERVAPLRLRAASRTSHVPHAGGSGSSARCHPLNPQPAASRVASQGGRRP